MLEEGDLNVGPNGLVHHLLHYALHEGLGGFFALFSFFF